MTDNELREKIAKEIDFLSDHWVNGDDRPPFSFGGWRDEVLDTIMELIQEERKRFAEELIKAVEEIEIRTDDGGEYITDDTELMRTEVVETLKEQKQ